MPFKQDDLGVNQIGIISLMFENDYHIIEKIDGKTFKTSRFIENPTQDVQMPIRSREIIRLLSRGILIAIPFVDGDTRDSYVFYLLKEDEESKRQFKQICQAFNSRQA